MQKQNHQRRHGLLKRVLGLALLSLLASAGTGHGLTLDDLIFYASFDKELKPERQPVASSKPTVTLSLHAERNAVMLVTLQAKQN